LVEYQPNEVSDSVTAQSLFLLDGGANYQDGTTAFARTIHFGTPSELEKDIYTRLLKGLIAIESTPFPEGTTGHQIDAIIRQHLWLGGLEYAGETGHSMSHGLGVKGACISSLALKVGMVISIGTSLSSANDLGPGIYLPELGIRLKNVYLVVPHPTAQYNFFHNRLATQPKFIKLKALTYIPYQRKMVSDILTAQEIRTLSDYHKDCIERNECQTDAGRNWLREEASRWSAE